jgi:4'-phosphopantetheinyl transferase
METYWLEQRESELPSYDDWLSADEIAQLSRMRFPKRRADWRLGRWTAKHAGATYLNFSADHQTLKEIEVRPAASGTPELFVHSRPSDATISISHRDGIAACAIAPAGVQLGCDLELIEPRSDGFVADYFTSKEQELISRLPEQDRARLVSLIWSAKESALKALREGLRLDTRHVAVTFDSEINQEISAEGQSWYPLRVSGAGGETFRGWWHATAQIVRTLVGAPSPLPPLFLRVSAVSDRPVDLARA